MDERGELEEVSGGLAEEGELTEEGGELAEARFGDKG